MKILVLNYDQNCLDIIDNVPEQEDGDYESMVYSEERYDGADISWMVVPDSYETYHFSF